MKPLSPCEELLCTRFFDAEANFSSVAVKDIFEDYCDQVFVRDILRVMIEDVVKVLSITEWSKDLYKKVLHFADLLTTDPGKGFFPSSGYLLYALPILWISYCCEYKNYGRVYELDFAVRGLNSNKRHLQYSICAQFFNMFAGPPQGKSKLLENYTFETYGEQYRDCPERNSDHMENFDTLMHFLSVTGFSYAGPVVL